MPPVAFGSLAYVPSGFLSFPLLSLNVPGGSAGGFDSNASPLRLAEFSVGISVLLLGLLATGSCLFTIPSSVAVFALAGSVLDLPCAAALASAAASEGAVLILINGPMRSEPKRRTSFNVID
ncbi:hypothetical protein D3C87_1659360 [compost metagenome]